MLRIFSINAFNEKDIQNGKRQQIMLTEKVTCTLNKTNENINRIKAKTAKCLFILGVNKSFVFLCFFKKINKVKKNHMFENKEQSKEKSITTTSYMNNFF